MNTPRRSSLRSTLRALGATGLALAALAAGAAPAGAYVTPAQAEHAADRGANWFQANQEESGSLGSDWGMTALAAAGINAADARTALLAPSAQDYYLGEWQAEGPGGAGTDAARGILAGVAGGIQTSRISTAADATRSNLVARLAELWDGTQIGETGLLNDDIFGVLALRQAGAPQPMLERIVEYLRGQQHADGGWSWNASPSAPSDIDMTGSVLAAFCAAGVDVSDPDLGEALELLHEVQDPASGGFIAPPETFGIGLNTDTTGWVASGLVQCGIDPQGPEWTTAQGKTPLDYLISMQRPDGHFDWTEEYGGGSFETFNSVRPLVGVAFSSAPPPRLDGVSPAVRPAPVVDQGTVVPVTLVIDHGPGAADVRMCRVDTESGSSLDQVLADAESASTPEGCVAGHATEASAAGLRVTTLNGVAETPEYGWTARVDGSAPEATTSAPIGFGDLVFLQFEAKVVDPGPAPEVTVPKLVAPERATLPRQRVVVRWTHWDGDSVLVRMACPRGNARPAAEGRSRCSSASSAAGR